MEERIYKIRGRKEDLDVLEKLLYHIEYLGVIGASRNILVRVDGDGTGRIKVKDKDGNKLGNSKCNITQNVKETVLVGTYDIG